MSIILASASPRRRELLQMMGLEFEVIPALDEAEAEGLSPSETVAKIALGKALSVAKDREKDDIVIAADTLVCVDGKLLGKPKTEDEAAENAVRQRTSGVYRRCRVRRRKKHCAGRKDKRPLLQDVR